MFVNYCTTRQKNKRLWIEFCRTRSLCIWRRRAPGPAFTVCECVCACVWTAGELKNIIEWRECLAGQCARRPGAEPKMTSNALWPLLIKCENGKIAGKALFVPPERKKCACGGGDRKNKREGQRVKLYGSFLSAISKWTRAHARCCARTRHHTLKMNVLGGISKVSDGDEVGWTQKPFRCSHMKPFLNAVWRTVNV